MFSIDQRLARVLATDIETAPALELAVLAESCRAVSAAVVHTETRIAARAAVLAETDKSVGPVTDLFRNGGRSSSRSGRQAAKRGTTAAALPELAGGLSTGMVSPEHLDGAASAQRGLSDAEKQQFSARDTELAAKAAALSPEQFAKHARRVADDIKADRGESRLAQQRRDSVFDHWVDPATGMFRFSGALDPVRGEAVVNALGDTVDQLVAAAKNDPSGTVLGFEALDGETITRQQYAAHALSLLAGGHQRSAGRANVTLILDHQSAESGFHEDTVAETTRGTRVPPTTAGTVVL